MTCSPARMCTSPTKTTPTPTRTSPSGGSGRPTPPSRSGRGAGWVPGSSCCPVRSSAATSWSRPAPWCAGWCRTGAWSPGFRRGSCASTCLVAGGNRQYRPPRPHRRRMRRRILAELPVNNCGVCHDGGWHSEHGERELAGASGAMHLCRARGPAATPRTERRVGPDDLVASAAYQPEPTAAAAARRFVRDTLLSWGVTGEADGSDELLDDAVLLTSELVTNAVVHAGTQVKVTCRLADGAVEVVVRDGQPARLVPEGAEDEPSLERTGGRGLLLPAALASAWGVAYGRSSKAVWFRLALDGPGAG